MAGPEEVDCGLVDCEKILCSLSRFLGCESESIGIVQDC